MNIKLTLLTVACALALSACGDKTPPPAAPTATPPATSAEKMPATTPPAAAETTAAPVTKAATKGSKEAVVTDCATEFEGNDAMQYNVNSITIPSSCTDFTITLKHVGKMAATAMGHNVVITKFADMQNVASDGMKAGLAENYIKPGDDRVIAHSNIIGGGETTSFSFPVSKLPADGRYEFFCSFPGHAALMKGSIAVE